MDKQLHISTDFISGLLAGFISVSATNGLEVAKTRSILSVNTVANKLNYNGFMGTMKSIFKSEGFAGLYKGYTCTVVSTSIFHSLFFSFYNFSKPKFSSLLRNSKTGEVNKTMVNIGSSVSAAILCNIITNPLWVVKTRIQSQFIHSQNSSAYKNVLQSFNKIYKEEGMKALYKGLFASLIGVTHAMIYLPVYEAMKSALANTNDTISYKHIAISSILSKIIAVTATYPHIVIRTKLQDNRNANIGRQVTKFQEFKNMKNIIKEVYVQQGVKGFYRGIKFDLIRILPSNTITFVVYEIVKKQIEQKYSQKIF